MSLPPPLAAILRDNSAALLAALCLVTLFLLVGFLWTWSRLGRLTRLYNRLTRGTSGGNLEEILHEYMETVGGVVRRMEALETRVAALAENQQRCLQHVGLVRFDAFEEVGGEQSFAVVMTDARQTGVILSSVYSRADVRVYAKAVRDGQPSHPLTHEEQQALAQSGGR